MNRGYIVFIVEGESREPLIIANLTQIFFKSLPCIISLSAGENLYMLWNILKQDEYETDIIEVLREYSPSARKRLEEENLTRDNIEEIYLFFDYDGHQNNVPIEAANEDVVREMLGVFSNETELGKLYISYPMVEALRDFKLGECTAATSCFWKISQSHDYKTRSGIGTMHSDVRKYDINLWSGILRVFVRRLACLYGWESPMQFYEEREHIEPIYIYDKEQRLLRKGCLFILSAFPEFLLDYHRMPFVRSMVGNLRKLPDTCENKMSCIER